MADMPTAEPTATVWATYEDVMSRWISTTLAPDQPTIDAYLADASDLVNAEFPDLAARSASDPAVARRARLVVVRMVMRVLTNPDMLRSTTDTTGPFSGGVTYAAETLGGLYLSDDDRALLSASPARSQRAFTIDPTPRGPVSRNGLYTTQMANWPEDGS